MSGILLSKERPLLNTGNTGLRYAEAVRFSSVDVGKRYADFSYNVASERLPLN